MTRGLTERQDIVLRTIERLGPRAVDSQEILAALQAADPDFSVPAMYYTLDVLRARGYVKRRPPTSEELRTGNRSAHTRFVYELGQEPEMLVDHLTTRVARPMTLQEQLQALYQRRAGLLAELEPINEAIALAENQVKELLAFIEQHR